MRKVLIIGGSSDLGRELCQELPYHFINLDIQNNNNYASEFIEANICNIQSLVSIKSIDFDYVVHISGIHPMVQNQENENLLYEVNVKGVFNVLETIKNHSCKNYILISSSSAKNLKSEYGKSKFLAEKTLESFCVGNGFKGYSLRTRGFTPYYSSSYKSFEDYASWVLSGAVHIKDVVRCIDLCIKLPSPFYEQFTVDGRDNFDQNEKINWGVDMLKSKYPQYKDFISTLSIPNKAPTYQYNYNNPVSYYPNYGVNFLFEEYDKYKGENNGI